MTAATARIEPTAPAAGPDAAEIERRYHDLVAAEQDAWLETPEGQAWLKSMEEMEDERQGVALWEGRSW